VLLAIGLASCAPVIRGDADALNPLRAGVRELDPIVTRPRMMEQKSVYDRLDVPATAFAPFGAYGEVRAPDDVVIFVQIWHSWPELADLRGYQITLRADDAPPVPADSIKATVMPKRDRVETTTVRTERTAIARSGKVVGTADVTSLGIGDIESDLYRGRAVLVFRGQPVLSAQTRQLTLEIRNPRQVYRFTWHFHG